MNQEDRQLLLKDLCARLPYRVKVCLYEKETCILMGIDGCEVYLDVDSDSFRIESIKPYLRSMSNMTEEEEKEYRKTMDKYTHRLYPNSADFSEHTEYSWTTETFDFLNAHHLDYRGLIPMGLAIEAPKGMYNFN